MACCGLFGNIQDDEDHDYEADSQLDLPKPGFSPQSAVGSEKRADWGTAVPAAGSSANEPIHAEEEWVKDEVKQSDVRVGSVRSMGLSTVEEGQQTSAAAMASVGVGMGAGVGGAAAKARSKAKKDKAREGRKSADGVKKGTAAASTRVPSSATLSPEKRFDVKAFIKKMDKGVIVTKYSKSGKPASRRLFYDEGNKSVGWNEPNVDGHTRKTSFFKSVQEPLPIATMQEIVPASNLTTASRFCTPEAVARSFSLVFSGRTVNVTAPNEGEAINIITGLKELKKTALVSVGVVP